MMNKKQIILSLLAFQVVFLVWLHAQQEAQYTQYMYNTQTMNPAYAGTRGLFGLTALYRSQWIGLEGAPRTANFNLSAPVGHRKRIGLGLGFIKDEVGPADESTLTGDFSYSIPVSDGLKLAFGIKGGVNLLNVDYAKLNIHDPDDQAFQYNIDNRITPLIGAGLYLYGQKWYAGVSVPNMLETTHYDDSTVSNAAERAQFYGILGYVLQWGPRLEFKPAVLAKMVSGAPLALDLSANFRFNNALYLGVSYRFDAAVSGLAGFQVSDRIMLGYAYDYGIQELANYNSGSHEVFLRFEIGQRKEKLIIPRFF